MACMTPGLSFLTTATGFLPGLLLSGGFKEVDDLGSTQRPSWETSSSIPPPLHYSSTSAPPHLGLYHYLEILHLCIAHFQISGYSLYLLVSTSLFLGILPISSSPHPPLTHSGFTSHSSQMGPQGCLIPVMFTLTSWVLVSQALVRAITLSLRPGHLIHFPFALLEKVT